jgi:hypothetical protein
MVLVLTTSFWELRCVFVTIVVESYICVRSIINEQ